MKATVTLYLSSWTRTWTDATNVEMQDNVINFSTKEGLPVSLCGAWSCEGQKPLPDEQVQHTDTAETNPISPAQRAPAPDSLGLQEGLK